MSCQRECQFIEFEPGKWYLILEDTMAPKNCWDWRDYANAYGSFSSEEAAREFLRNNFSNPGGSSTLPYDEKKAKEWKEDKTLLDLIQNAESNLRTAQQRYVMRR